MKQSKTKQNKAKTNKNTMMLFSEDRTVSSLDDTMLSSEDNTSIFWRYHISLSSFEITLCYHLKITLVCNLLKIVFPFLKIALKISGTQSVTNVCSLPSWHPKAAQSWGNGLHMATPCRVKSTRPFQRRCLVCYSTPPLDTILSHYSHGWLGSVKTLSPLV